jgi:predicted DNA-binding transcriptional regulator AlpA
MATRATDQFHLPASHPPSVRVPATQPGPSAGNNVLDSDGVAMFRAQTPSSRPLTSWKEIAAYMGKGVRTVQRWERESQFPVHRPMPDRHRVIAYPHEIDAWTKKDVAALESAERKLERLCNELTDLVAEQPTLFDRARQLCCAVLENTVGFPKTFDASSRTKVCSAGKRQ